MKKLKLHKEVIAELTDKEQDFIKGGELIETIFAIDDGITLWPTDLCVLPTLSGNTCFGPSCQLCASQPKTKCEAFL